MNVVGLDLGFQLFFGQAIRVWLSDWPRILRIRPSPLLSHPDRAERSGTCHPGVPSLPSAWPFPSVHSRADVPALSAAQLLAWPGKGYGMGFIASRLRASFRSE